MRKIKTLKKNYEFKNVLNKGKFYLGKQIIIYVSKNKINENRIGIAISTKLCKAVKRNRLQGYNIVFLWNKKADFHEADFFKVGNDMKSIFKKIGIL